MPADGAILCPEPRKFTGHSNFAPSTVLFLRSKYILLVEVALRPSREQETPSESTVLDSPPTKNTLV